MPQTKPLCSCLHIFHTGKGELTQMRQCPSKKRTSPGWPILDTLVWIFKARAVDSSRVVVVVFSGFILVWCVFPPSPSLQVCFLLTIACFRLFEDEHTLIEGVQQHWADARMLCGSVLFIFKTWFGLKVECSKPTCLRWGTRSLQHEASVCL